jgi:hypothetical protein
LWSRGALGKFPALKAAKAYYFFVFLPAAFLGEAFFAGAFLAGAFVAFLVAITINS